MGRCCNQVSSGPNPYVPANATTGYVRARWTGMTSAATVARREFIGLATTAEAGPRLVLPVPPDPQSCDPTIPRVGPTSYP